MKASEGPMKLSSENEMKPNKKKPPFRPAKDDTKPFLQDPVLSSHNLFACIYMLVQATVCVCL